MGIVYKVKHKETGLYYKPGRSSNLDPVGKIYKTKLTVLSPEDYSTGISIHIYKNTRFYKKYGQLIEEKIKTFKVCRSNDWEIYFIANKDDFELEAFEETVVYKKI